MHAMATGTGISCEDEFAFWTAERIRNAIPADGFLYTAQQQDQTYHPTGAEGPENVSVTGGGILGSLPPPREPGNEANSEGFREISLDKLTTAPYHSVGKLVTHGEYTDAKGKVKEMDKCATAFYIGNSTLLTVAHVFSRSDHVKSEDDNISITTFKETRGGVFIPAFIAPDLVHPCRNYGKFLFRPGRLGGYFLHPNYDPLQRNPQYDICTVKICKGVRDNKLIDSIDNIGLQPFIVHRDENYTPQTTWRVVGYPHLDVPPEWRQYLNRVFITGMFEVTGTYTRRDQETVIIDTSAQILGGVSGGPWIMEAGAAMQGVNMIVNGVQAGKPFGYPPRTAISPYISSDLFREMQLQVDDENQVDMEVLP